MTNEEAINYFERSYASGDTDDERQHNEAIDMAIKMLKQQTCDDCITKAEVIDTIHKTIYGFFDIADDDSEEPMSDKDKLLLTINKALSNAVKALPSVTPQRSKGKWIQTKDDCDGVNFYDFSFECSKCKKEQSFKSNYCPNCGAYMRESEDKE